MHAFREEFLAFSLARDVLKFGDFITKAGRDSPYFFNAGLFNDGESLRRLGGFYADALLASGIAFDHLFGPAYKGITLAAATAIALAEKGHNLPFSYNRKEAKDHGEGGVVVGAPLARPRGDRRRRDHRRRGEARVDRDDPRSRARSAVGGADRAGPQGARAGRERRRCRSCRRSSASRSCAIATLDDVMAFVARRRRSSGRTRRGSRRIARSTVRTEAAREAGSVKAGRRTRAAVGPRRVSVVRRLTRRGRSRGASALGAGRILLLALLSLVAIGAGGHVQVGGREGGRPLHRQDPGRSRQQGQHDARQAGAAGQEDRPGGDARADPRARERRRRTRRLTAKANEEIAPPRPRAAFVVHDRKRDRPRAKPRARHDRRADRVVRRLHAAADQAARRSSRSSKAKLAGKPDAAWRSSASSKATRPSSRRPPR